MTGRSKKGNCYGCGTHAGIAPAVFGPRRAQRNQTAGLGVWQCSILTKGRRTQSLAAMPRASALQP